jgi:hypothetical protein
LVGGLFRWFCRLRLGGGLTWRGRSFTRRWAFGPLSALAALAPFSRRGFLGGLERRFKVGAYVIRGRCAGGCFAHLP